MEAIAGGGRGHRTTISCGDACRWPKPGQPDATLSDGAAMIRLPALAFAVLTAPAALAHSPQRARRPSPAGSCRTLSIPGWRSAPPCCATTPTPCSPPALRTGRSGRPSAWPPRAPPPPAASHAKASATPMNGFPRLTGQNCETIAAPAMVRQIGRRQAPSSLRLGTPSTQRDLSHPASKGSALVAKLPFIPGQQDWRLCADCSQSRRSRLYPEAEGTDVPTGCAVQLRAISVDRDGDPF